MLRGLMHRSREKGPNQGAWKPPRSTLQGLGCGALSVGNRIPLGDTPCLEPSTVP